MSDIATLQDRLDKRADHKLKNDIDAAAKPLESLIGCSTLYTGLDNGKGKEYTDSDCIRAIKNKLHAYLKQNRREMETKEFLARVDSVQAEIDQLRESVSQD